MNRCWRTGPSHEYCELSAGHTERGQPWCVVSFGQRFVGKIPSATEAAERSPEPAQTTPAKDSG